MIHRSLDSVLIINHCLGCIETICPYQFKRGQARYINRPPECLDKRLVRAEERLVWRLQVLLHLPLVVEWARRHAVFVRCIGYFVYGVASPGIPKSTSGSRVPNENARSWGP